MALCVRRVLPTKRFATDHLLFFFHVTVIVTYENLSITYFVYVFR